MKADHFYSLNGFNLDLSDLWTSAAGPHWDDSLTKLVDKSANALLAKTKSGEVGFYDWPKNIGESTLNNLENVAKRLRRDFDGALIIGIGGSFLGAASIVQALGEPDWPLVWLSNIDPRAIENVKLKIKGKKFCTLIVSKSGNTTETMAGFFHLAPLLPKEGYVAITDPIKGELRRMANEFGWTSFEVPENIGGRFSVLSAVGLLPALLAGISAKQLIEGAKRLRDRLDASSPTENPAYLFALAKYLWDAKFNYPVQVLMPYWSSLQLFADWYVQLWGESLGKKTLRDSNLSVGATPLPALGTTDQHSMLQLFKEGPGDKIVGFMDILGSVPALKVGRPEFDPGSLKFLCEHSFEKISHEACLATQQSLRNSKVPTYRFELPQLDASTLGALFFFFETACAIAGEFYGVNAFDQPGVEESKNLLRKAL